MPEWVREAASHSAPEYPPRVSTVTLLREENVTIEPDGRVVTRDRRAMRVLQHERQGLRAVVEYNPRGGKVREFQGWVLPPSGKAISLGKNAAADVSLATSYEYDEGRARVLDAGSNLDPGSVFAWEAVSEEKTIFAQYE